MVFIKQIGLLNISDSNFNEVRINLRKNNKTFTVPILRDRFDIFLYDHINVNNIIMCKILTFLFMLQLLLAISVVWGGPLTNYTPSWHASVQQALRIFSMYSCLLWTSMLSVGLLMLQVHLLLNAYLLT